MFGGAQEVEEGAISRIRWLCGRLQRRFAPEQKILALLHRSMPAAGTRDEHEHLGDRIQQFAAERIFEQFEQLIRPVLPGYTVEGHSSCDS